MYKSVAGKDRQYTYNLTLLWSLVTFVVVENQKLLHILSVCVYSPKYPACALLSSVAFPSLQSLFLITWGLQFVRFPNFFSVMEADRNVKVVGGDVAVL